MRISTSCIIMDGARRRRTDGSSPPMVHSPVPLPPSSQTHPWDADLPYGRGKLRGESGQTLFNLSGLPVVLFVASIGPVPPRSGP